LQHLSVIDAMAIIPDRVILNVERLLCDVERGMVICRQTGGILPHRPKSDNISFDAGNFDRFGTEPETFSQRLFGNYTMNGDK